MLEGIFVVAHVMVVIVGIGKEVIAPCKYKGLTHVHLRQICPLRSIDGENILSQSDRLGENRNPNSLTQYNAYRKN